MKKYIANTDVSMSIVLPGGGKMRVVFTPLTGGGSVYYTDNERVQSGLERHYKFGRLFRLSKEVEAETCSNPDGSAKEPDETDGVIGEVEIKQIIVADPDEAKDYLCEHYSLSRTALRSLKSIKDAAAVHNIEFKGI